MGIKTRHLQGGKIKARCRCLNHQISSMDNISFENWPFGLKNASFSPNKQPDVFNGLGTTRGLSEGNGQPHVVPLIMFGQATTVHIPGAGLVPAFVLGNPVIDNTEIGSCQWTNAAVIGTNMPCYQSVNGISQTSNASSKNWCRYKKERCSCELFKESLDGKTEADQDKDTTQSPCSKLNSAGDSCHQNAFETICSGGTGIIKFEPPILSDYIIKKGQSTQVSAKLQCITGLQNYEKKSLEELRLEDYLAQNKANPAVNSSNLRSFGMLQTTDFFGQQSAFGKPLTCNFGCTTSSAAGINSFAQNPTFGKPVSNFTFGLSSTSGTGGGLLSMQTSTGQPLTSITTNNLPSTTSAAGNNIFRLPTITPFDKPKSNFSFGQPLISGTANNISTTTISTSTTGTSIFGQTTMTSFGKTKSDSQFGQPLTSGTTNNIPTTTTSTSTTGTSIFGQATMASFGKPKSDFSFGQPLISGTTNSISTTTTSTSTTGTSIFGQPTMASFGKPKSDFSFGQPLISGTTNNISTTTTSISTTGTSIFGQPTMTSFGNPKSDFSFGKPLISGPTNNISTATTSTSTTGTSIFGQATMASFGKPKSDFSFGQPLISGTTNNISTTTTSTSTTGTSIFGQATMASFGKPKSDFSFGQPLISDTTNNISTTTTSTSTTGTSIFGQATMASFGKPKSDFSFGQPLISDTTNNISTTTTSTSTTGTSIFGQATMASFGRPKSDFSFGISNSTPTTTTATSITATGMFGQPACTMFDKCGTFQFGQTLTSTTTNNLPKGFQLSLTSNTLCNQPSTTSSATSPCSIVEPKMLYTKPRNVSFDGASKPSSTSSPATETITFGTPLSSSSNDVLSSAACPKTTSTFGQSTLNKNAETNSIESISKPTTTFGSISAASLSNSKAKQQISGIFGQQIESKCVPPPTLSSSAKCSTMKAVSGFRFDQPAAGGLFKPTNVQHMAVDGFFTQQTSPKYFPSTNLSSILKPFFAETPKNVFNKPNASFPHQVANNTSPFASQVFPGFKPSLFSISPWKNNNLKATEKPAASNLFNQATFGPTQSNFAESSQGAWHFNNVCSCNKPPFRFQQPSNLALQHGTSNSARFAFDRANPFQQGFQANLQQPNTSPFGMGTQNTAQSSFFSQSKQPELGLGEIPSIAVICYMPGNPFCSTGPAMNNVFGYLEQNSANWMGSKRCPYYSTFENDPVTKLPINTHCITRMKEYENKSVEELRFEDYLVKDKNRQTGARRIIEQVQLALTQLLRDINNKPMNNSFGQQTEDLRFVGNPNNHIMLF